MTAFKISAALGNAHRLGQRWRGIRTLRSRRLWAENDCRPFSRLMSRNQPDRNDAKRSAAALVVWRSAKQTKKTLVETYLGSRRLHPAPTMLSFHAGPRQPSGSIWPAIVAPVTRGTDHTPFAIQRRDRKRAGPVIAACCWKRLTLVYCGRFYIAAADRRREWLVSVDPQDRV